LTYTKVLGARRGGFFTGKGGCLHRRENSFVPDSGLTRNGGGVNGRRGGGSKKKREV